LFSFHGQPGTSGAIAFSSADSTFTGPGFTAHVGLALTNLGPILNPVFPSVGAGSPSDAISFPGSSGTAFVFSGPPTTSPFGSNLVVGYNGTPSKVGEAVAGGGVSGRAGSYSLIGNATPDLVVAPQGGGVLFSIVDGSVLGGLASPVDLTTAAAVQVAVPPNWGATVEDGMHISPDLNGDTYPDIIASSLSSPVGTTVVIYW
jgi:hypothetical protein